LSVEIVVGDYFKQKAQEPVAVKAVCGGVIVRRDPVKGWPPGSA
jgi:hypothetical protein